MLAELDADSIISVVAIVVGVILIIRLILLGGHLVRAVEKIAEKQ